MKKSILMLLASGLLTASVSAAAAEPEALMRYDFRGASSGGTECRSAAGSAPVLHLGAGVTKKDNALEFSRAEDSCAWMDDAVWKSFIRGKDLRDFSFAFWIRFDKSLFGGKEKKAPFGLFDCVIGEDGCLGLVIPAQPTDLLTTEIPVRSKVKAEYGKWHHIEFAFSANSRRYYLYIDGRFQYHSDQLLMPVPALASFRIGPFCGAVRDFRFYNAALSSEELALTDAGPEAFDALAGKASGLLKTTKNAALKNWIEKLRAAAVSYKENRAFVTIAQLHRLERSLENAARLSRELAGGNVIGDQNFTVYSVPAATQELYLPYILPDNGALTDKLELFLAQDEYESASLLIVPFEKIGQFTIEATDFVCGNAKIPADSITIKLVKRLFRSGGAWLSYHMDSQMRVLTPDLLVNDDKLFRVDEFRRTNEMLMHYPGGDQYTQVSNFDYDNDFLRGDTEEFFYDAPTLQPVTLTEAGRNQQYVIRFHAAKNTPPGFYKGKIHFKANGKIASSMDVTLRVLPFVLPQPKSYDNVDKTYLSHINRLEEESFGDLKNAMEYNFMHITNAAISPRQIGFTKQAGYQLDEIFIRKVPGDFKFDFGGPDSFITPELDRQMDRMALRPYEKLQKMIEKYSGKKDFMVYHCYSSEAGRYDRICREPDRISNLLHENGHFKLFSHGMVEALEYYSPGVYDMNSSTVINRGRADVWHAAGGRNISYAFPFPGPENPGLMRRALGLETYKRRLDGHMMHGYITRQFNEFAKWPGGDGNYRTFSVAFRQKNGFINRLCIIGCREGYDDVRYATMLRTQALKYRDSKDPLISREAKRQLVWLERWDGDLDDMDAFRTAAASRILALMNLVSKREGKK